MVFSRGTAEGSHCTSLCTQERTNGHTHVECYPDAYMLPNRGFCPPIEVTRTYPFSTAPDVLMSISGNQHSLSNSPPQHQFQQSWSIRPEAARPLVLQAFPKTFEELDEAKDQSGLLIERKNNQEKAFTPALNVADCSPPRAAMFNLAQSHDSKGISLRANGAILPDVQTTSRSPRTLRKKKATNSRQALNEMPFKRKVQAGHNVIEKRYRDRVQQRFEALRGLLSELDSNSACENSSKWNVMEHAVSCIKSLQTRNEELQAVNVQLMNHVDVLKDIIAKNWAFRQNSLPHGLCIDAPTYLSPTTGHTNKWQWPLPVERHLDFELDCRRMH